MRSRYVFALLASSSLAAVTAAAAGECSAEENGYYYDISSLQAKEDYQVKTESGRVFTLNVCGAVASETWKLDNPSSVAAFYRGPHSDISIGSVNKSLRIVQSHPLLVLSDGSPCLDGSSTLRASSLIRFICDNDVFGQGNPQLVAQLPPEDDSSCAFIFEWRTHIACPTSKPSPISGIIAVTSAIALILFISYIIIGVTYRRFALGYRGFDQLPRIAFFQLSAIPHILEDLLDRLRDIRDNLRGGARDIWPRSSSTWNPRNRGFSPLAREEREAIFRDTPDPRFSIDDDQPPPPPPAKEPPTPPPL